MLWNNNKEIVDFNSWQRKHTEKSLRECIENLQSFYTFLSNL